MAPLPRFPPPVEHRVLKRVCELPPRVLRRLFGPPPAIDGQTLASDGHALLRMAELSGAGSIVHGVTTVEALREETRFGAAVSQPRPPIPMARVEPVAIPGRAGTIPARLYVPGGPSAPAPASLLVFYHGGGWVVGDLETHDGLCRFLAAAAGTAVLSVDYRLAPEHPFPAAVDDALDAFNWAAANAADLGVDPRRIAVGGDSAGGNLAAVVSRLARDAGGPMPAMQLLIYPVTDGSGDFPSRQLFAEGFLLTKRDMDFFEAHYLPDSAAVHDPRVSIIEVPDLSGLPPAYVTTAGFDPLRDEGEAYAQRMREAGVRVALRRHPGLFHSFANLTAVNPSARAAMREAAGALRMGLASA